MTEERTLTTLVTDDGLYVHAEQLIRLLRDDAADLRAWLDDQPEEVDLTTSYRIAAVSAVIDYASKLADDLDLAGIVTVTPP